MGAGDKLEFRLLAEVQNCEGSLSWWQRAEQLLCQSSSLMQEAGDFNISAKSCVIWKH